MKSFNEYLKNRLIKNEINEINKESIKEKNKIINEKTLKGSTRMLKRLLCFILGHSLDPNDKRYYNDEFTWRKMTLHGAFRCDRCKDYIKPN